MIGLKGCILAVALLAQAATNNSCGAPSGPNPSYETKYNQLSRNQEHNANMSRQAYESLHITENAEVESIRDYIRSVTTPGSVGYVTLFTLGRPIAYYAIKGPVVDCARELTPILHAGGYNNETALDAPNDEGTYGGNEHCHFFKTEDGVFIRWSGEFLYSSQPIRLSEKPLVIDVHESR